MANWFDVFAPMYNQGVYNQPGTIMAPPNLETQSLLDAMLRGVTNFGYNTITAPGKAIEAGARALFTPGHFAPTAPVMPQEQPANITTPPPAPLTASPLATRGSSTAVGNPATVFSLPMGASGGYMQNLNTVEGETKNPRSSANGPGQFIDSTFKQFMRETHPEIKLEGDLDQYKKAYGKEATAWYAGKNADVFQKTGIPVNDWTLRLGHFLDGPVAAKVISANPNTPIEQLVGKDAIASNPEVLGGGKTAGQVVAWAQRQMPGSNIIPPPPVQEAFQAPRMPTIPAPPQMGSAVAPDYSVANAFMDKAKPMAYREGDDRQMRMLSALGGLASGAARFAPEAGSTGRILAAAGGGSADQLSGAISHSMQMRNQLDQRNQNYYTMRGNAATDQAATTANVLNKNTEIAFQNSKLMWDTTIQNSQNQYKVDTENKLREIEARTKNDASQYEWLQKVQQFTMPKILKADDKGITMQVFDPQKETIDIKHFPLDTINTQLDMIKKMSAMGGPLGDAMKYNYIMTAVGQQNPLLARTLMGQEIIEEVIKNGGAGKLGKAYTDAIKIAGEEVAKEAPAMQTKPEELQNIIIRRAAGKIIEQMVNTGKDVEYMKQLIPYSQYGARLYSGGR